MAFRFLLSSSFSMQSFSAFKRLLNAAIDLGSSSQSSKAPILSRRFASTSSRIFLARALIASRLAPGVFGKGLASHASHASHASFAAFALSSLSFSAPLASCAFPSYDFAAAFSSTLSCSLLLLCSLSFKPFISLFLLRWDYFWCALVLLELEVFWWVFGRSCVGWLPETCCLCWDNVLWCACADLFHSEHRFCWHTHILNYCLTAIVKCELEAERNLSYLGQELQLC